MFFNKFKIHIFSPQAVNPLMPDQQVQKDFTNDPVFYGPDGNVLTEEESAFLWNETYYDEDDEYVFVAFYIIWY